MTRKVLLALVSWCAFGGHAPRITQDMLPLHVSGRYIVARDGCTRVKLSCVNWAGAHLKKAVPAGLHMRTPDYLAKALADIGFNCVRVVYALQSLSAERVDPFWVGNGGSSQADWVNPGLNGSTALEVLDAVVLACVRAGLAVVVNNHNSDLGWCCRDDDHNGLWWNSRFPREAWHAHVRSVTQRYSAPQYNGMVIGFDLRNELRSSEVAGRWHEVQWGGGSLEEDWREAAMEASAYVLRNSHMLAIVEGIQYAAIVCVMADNPFPAWMANRTVYSVHQYRWTQMGYFLPVLTLHSLSLRGAAVWLLVVLASAAAAARCQRLEVWLQYLGGRALAVALACFAAGGVLLILSAILIAWSQCLLLFRIAVVACQILGLMFLLSGASCVLGGCARRGGCSAVRWRGRQRRQLRLSDALEGIELEQSLQADRGQDESPRSPWPPLAKGVGMDGGRIILPAAIVMVPLCFYLSSALVWWFGTTRWAFDSEVSAKWGRFLGSAPPLPIWVGEYGPGYAEDQALQFRYFIDGDVDLAYWQMAGENGLKDDGTFKRERFGIFGLDYNASNLGQPESVMEFIRQTFVPHVTSLGCSS